MEQSNDKQSIQKDADATLSRRGFLKQGGGVIGLAVMPTAGIVAATASQEVMAADFPTLGESVGRTLMRMARDIFPHDKLADKYYAGVIVPFDKDDGKKAMIVEGVNNLNALALKRHGKPYADVASEGDRVGMLYAIEQTAFFATIRTTLLYGIYNNKEVWPVFGYEGSSWEKGGYIDRGFNNVDWV